MKLLYRVRLLATPWTVAHQGPRSMGFSRQEYWSGVPLPSPVIMYACIQLLFIIFIATPVIQTPIISYLDYTKPF